MPETDRASVIAQVAARYERCGRFARHYVAGKLKHDPLTRALLAEGLFGRVLDLGCGRGQFAGLLLQAGLAGEVTGLDANPRLLADARRALDGLAFRAVQRDLSRHTALPEADTVLIVDVLYQLAPEAQEGLLAAACASAGRRLLIRMADPGAGLRGRFTDTAERLGRCVWPHAGQTVAAQTVSWTLRRVEAAGFRATCAPSRAGTPFSNVLMVATRAGSP
jgi:SAM-dependent methyltransferase